MTKTNARRDPEDERPGHRGMLQPRRAHHRRPTPSPALSTPRPGALYLAHQADREVVTRLSHIRDNMVEYSATYPAAVEVRDKLGVAKWEALERSRMRAVNFSEWMRNIDREKRSLPRWQLEIFIPIMKTHIQRVCGDRSLKRFEKTHENLDGIIDERTCMGCGIQKTAPMSHFQYWLHQRPRLWFAYNLYFPIVNPNPTKMRGTRRVTNTEGRMTWHQLMEWAAWTHENPDVEGQVPLGLPGHEGVIWNRAMIELYRSTRQAFSAQE